MTPHSKRLLRYTWSSIFLWFGIQQLVGPDAWVSLLPEWAGYLPVPGDMLIQLNGWSEIVLATMLMLGVWYRPVILFLTIHLALITMGMSGATQVRDLGLTMIGIALLFDQRDAWPVSLLTSKHAYCRH